MQVTCNQRAQIGTADVDCAVAGQKIGDFLKRIEIELFEIVTKERKRVFNDLIGEECRIFLFLELLAELIFKLIETFESELLAEADDRCA